MLQPIVQFDLHQYRHIHCLTKFLHWPFSSIWICYVLPASCHIFLSGNRYIHFADASDAVVLRLIFLCTSYCELALLYCLQTMLSGANFIDFIDFCYTFILVFILELCHRFTLRWIQSWIVRDKQNALHMHSSFSFRNIFEDMFWHNVCTNWTTC